MAKKTKRNYGSTRNNSTNNYSGRKSKSKFTDLERTAYQMGIIMTGLNDDTRVSESYFAGCRAKENKAKGKKPLY